MRHQVNYKQAEHKKRLQTEAEERAKQRAKRSDAEQLAKLNAGNFTATKERARLNKRL